MESDRGGDSVDHTARRRTWTLPIDEGTTGHTTTYWTCSDETNDLCNESEKDDPDLAGNTEERDSGILPTDAEENHTSDEAKDIVHKALKPTEMRLRIRSLRNIGDWSRNLNISR